MNITSVPYLTYNVNYKFPKYGKIYVKIIDTIQSTKYISKINSYQPNIDVNIDINIDINIDKKFYCDR
jgi:hypothetical protein